VSRTCAATCTEADGCLCVDEPEPQKLAGWYEPGEYFLFVDGFNGGAGPFDLRLDLAAVLPGNEDCARAEAITVAPGATAVVRSSTLSAADDHRGACGRDGGRDLVFKVEIDAPGPLSAQLESAFRAALYVTGGCGAADVGCSAGPRSPQRVELTDLAAGTWYIYVDGWQTGAFGDFRLEVRR
jgi:hypothetical protein